MIRNPDQHVCLVALQPLIDRLGKSVHAKHPLCARQAHVVPVAIRRAGGVPYEKMLILICMGETYLRNAGEKKRIVIEPSEAVGMDCRAGFD